MKTISLWALILASAALMTGPAPASAAGAVLTKPIRLTKIYADLPTGAVYARVKLGLLCIGGNKSVYNGGRRLERLDPYLPPFQAEMEKAGFKAGRSDNIFESNNDGADYEIGAIITDQQIDACMPNVYSQSIKGEATMKVEWQVYSRLRQQVVAHFSTSGAFNLPNAVPGAIPVLSAGAFAANARQLAANPQFAAALAASTPDAGAVLPPDQQTRIALAGSNDAPGRSVAEAAGDVVVVLNGTSSGSGVLLSEDGYIVTDAHVVGDATTVKIRWSDGLETAGRVVRSNRSRDVALIRSDARGRTPLPVRRQGLTPGQTVFAIGAPLGTKFQGTVSRGVVSASRVFDGLSYIQSDVAVSPGSSGGPLLDESGYVVGLTVSRVLGRDEMPTGLNLFIPIGDALDFLGLDRG